MYTKCEIRSYSQTLIHIYLINAHVTTLAIIQKAILDFRGHPWEQNVPNESLTPRFFLPKLTNQHKVQCNIFRLDEQVFSGCVPEKTIFKSVFETTKSQHQLKVCFMPWIWQTLERKEAIFDCKILLIYGIFQHYSFTYVPWYIAKKMTDDVFFLHLDQLRQTRTMDFHSISMEYISSTSQVIIKCPLSWNFIL